LSGFTWFHRKVFLVEKLFVRFHMAPHESVPPSSQSSMEEGGESTPEEGGEEHPRAEGGEGEPPLSLVDLLGFVDLIICNFLYFVLHHASLV
jgi:hypothetical protein